MHKRIIWTLFLAAFILDFFRSRTTSEEPDSLPENNRENEINIDDKPNKPKDKKNKKINNEDLRNTYEENYEDTDTQKINKKRKNFIDLRIEFCQS